MMDMDRPALYEALYSVLLRPPVIAPWVRGFDRTVDDEWDECYWCFERIDYRSAFLEGHAPSCPYPQVHEAFASGHIIVEE